MAVRDEQLTANKNVDSCSARPTQNHRVVQSADLSRRLRDRTRHLPRSLAVHTCLIPLSAAHELIGDHLFSFTLISSFRYPFRLRPATGVLEHPAAAVRSGRLLLFSAYTFRYRSAQETVTYFASDLFSSHIYVVRRKLRVPRRKTRANVRSYVRFTWHVWIERRVMSSTIV